jgi:uncharacterized damage-inducible protein DinB
MEELMREMLRTLIRYNYHTNRRLLTQAAGLTDEQFNRPSRIGEDSLRELLLHTMRTEWFWRNLAYNGTLPGPPPSDEVFLTLEAIQSRWLEEEEAMNKMLGEMNEIELNKVIELTDRKGVVHNYTRWGMLMHMLMHSMQHRSEAAVFLTEFGLSPGDLDLIYFLADQTAD